MIWIMVKQKIQLIQSDKVLRDKAFKIVSDPNMTVIKEDQLLWFTSFLIKKYQGSDITNASNYKLANELHKPIIKKLKKRKLYFHLGTTFGVLIQLICNL